LDHGLDPGILKRNSYHNRMGEIVRLLWDQLHLGSFIMRPSSLGGGRILRRTLSVCPCVPFWSVTWRHLANYN